VATGDYVYVLADDSEDIPEVIGAWVRKYEAVRWMERNIPEGRTALYTVTTIRSGSKVVNEESGLHFLERNRA
jgi:hypothetical protein